MSLRTLTLATLLSASVLGIAIAAPTPSLGHSPAHISRSTQMKLPTRYHAKAAINVQSSTAKPFDQTADPKLMVLDLVERFTGDIEAESTVRALQAQHPDNSATLVSLQRVSGKLGGRQGTFVLQGQETVEKGRIKATWIVVPGSGTGELVGLRGEGGFQGGFGIGSTGTLDYWFE